MSPLRRRAALPNAAVAVRAFAVYDDGNDLALYAGGDFLTSGGAVSPYLARFGCPPILGDLNCDAAVNFFDIDPFLLALFDPAGYAAAFPECRINRADMNTDDAVNFFDIDPFIACLFGSCP